MWRWSRDYALVPGLSVVCRATLQARPTLFGQFRKVHSPKFGWIAPTQSALTRSLACRTSLQPCHLHRRGRWVLSTRATQSRLP
jgi:hypothetical protein